MNFWRQLTAMVLAAAMAVSPTLACAPFCPHPPPAVRGAEAFEDADPAFAAAAMPADCADAMNAPAEHPSPAPAHDPDCHGCGDCPAMISAESPALAFGQAVSVEAPSLITLAQPSFQAADGQRQVSPRLTPPANGPPIYATPILLKDKLRL